MKLTNYSAKEIQKSLHQDYHSSEIEIVRRYTRAIYYIIKEIIQSNETFKENLNLIKGVLLTRRYTGLYSEHTKTSYVFMSNYHKELDDVIKELCGVQTLLHELRHHVQHTKYPKLLRVAEKDAERFAWKFFDRKYELYKSILEKQQKGED